MATRTAVKLDGPFYIKRDDTAPALSVLLLGGTRARTPVDLTDATVSFLMRQVKGTKVVSGDADAGDQETDPGTVSYTWGDGDTETPGVYRAEFEVTFDDDSIETFPSDEYIEVVVLGDLG